MAEIYGNSTIGKNTYMGKNLIIGYPGKDELEYLVKNELEKIKGAKIGNNCILRDYGVIYSNAVLGNNIKTGHYVIVREYTTVGDNTLIGSGTVIEDRCKIGKNVSIQSNVYIPTNTVIEDYVFLGPNATLTNDKYMGRGKVELVGPIIEKGARIGANSTILPGIRIGRDSLVAAGAVVTKNVAPYTIVAGIPAKKISAVPEAHKL